MTPRDVTDRLEALERVLSTVETIDLDKETKDYLKRRLILAVHDLLSLGS